MARNRPTAMPGLYRHAGPAQREATVRLVFSDGHVETVAFPLLGPSR